MTRIGAVVLLTAGLLSQVPDEDLSAFAGRIGLDGHQFLGSGRFDLLLYVLGAAGVILLTASSAGRRRARCSAYAWTARVTVIFGLVVVAVPVIAPALLAWTEPTLFSCMFLTMLASTSLYAYLGSLFRYSGRPSLSRHAFLLAGLFPLQNIVPALSFVLDSVAEQFGLGIFTLILTVPGVGPRHLAGTLVSSVLRYPALFLAGADVLALSGLVSAITTLLVLLLTARLAVAPAGRAGPDKPPSEKPHAEC